MTQPVIKATLREAIELLKEWYLTEGRTPRSDIRVRSMRLLQAAGAIAPLKEAPSASGKEGEG
jgi:hypothetical protein